LALVYNGGNDSSLLGVGWSISGLSAITRCPRTWAQDGESRDVRNDSSDRFCLGGNKLRLVSGTYGAANATYQTEFEAFSRFTSYDTAGISGPGYFIVEGKDGLIYEYGNSADSRIESVGQTYVRAWALNKVRDRSQNAITFSYIEDTTNGSYRIGSIAYASNATQGVAATHTVEFVWETKPTNEIDSGYVAGSIVKQITRLDRIDVKYGATVVRRYELTYEAALSSTSKSRLASLQECAGSPLDCVPATSFTYQNGTPGLASDTNTGVSLLTTPFPLDVNGDGRDDLVYSSSATSGSGYWMVMLASASGGYNAPASTGVVNTNYSGAVPIDYNADGLQDLLVPYSGGTWWVMLGNASGLAAPTNTGAPATSTGPNAKAMDVDGDGLEDLVWADLYGYVGGDAIRYRLRVWGGQFSTIVNTLVGPYPADQKLTNIFSGQRNPNDSRRVLDFNGDGRGDFLYQSERRIWEDEQQRYITTPSITVFCIGAWTIGANWLGGYQALFFGDFNGDGKTDVLYRDASGSHRMQFSTGKTLTTNALVSAPSVTVQAILDWDGDGYDDALARHATNGTWYVIRSTGEGFVAPVATGQSAGTAIFTVMDVNGDGLADFGNTVSGAWDFRLHSGVHPDFLQTATDGFGNSATFAYVPVAQGSYTKLADASYPEQDYQGPLNVVSGLTASDGIGGTYSNTFTYSGARLNLQGRGFEGFYSKVTYDSRDQLRTYEYFDRLFPYTGTVFQRDVVQPNNSTLIERAQNTWASHNYSNPSVAYETRSFPYVSQSTTSSYEAEGAYNAQLIRTVVQQNTVDSGTGTVSDTIATTTEPSGANGVQAGASYVQRQYIPSLVSSTANWCLGRPGQTQLINSHNQTGGAAITRTTDITWDTTACRPTQVVDEQGNTQLQVTRTLGYDAFGNISSDSVTGIGMTARTTNINWGTSGRFPQTVTNALSQATQYGWDPMLGTLTSVTDPNSLLTTWQYDGFGRRTREGRPDETATRYTINACINGCLNPSNLRMFIAAEELDSSSSVVTTKYYYFDQWDRHSRTAYQLLGGGWAAVNRSFNNRGLVAQTSAPYFSAGTKYFTTYQYDMRGRATQVSRPTSDSNPALQTTYNYYEGLTTRSVDPLNKQATHVANALGGMARSIDHDGYSQTFSYDAFGNVVQVTDSLSNTLQSNTFNIRGVRTGQTDMDAGTWSFTPNALGEIVSQTDTKSQSSTFGYDRLGRMYTRTEAEGTSTWTWGTSAAAKNIGRLASMSGPGYAEGYVYDSVTGKLKQRNITSDASYSIDYSYNAFGAIDTLTYPVSTSSYRLKLQYDYQYGHLLRVKDFNAPTTVFWTANGMDASGEVNDETLGNGVQTIRSVDLVTGLPDSILSGPAANGSIQNLSYTWDAVGNLTQRQDVRQGLTENFYYDNLHRLTSVTGPDSMTIAYDAMGNITSKSGVGTYSYHATKKHAVVSAGGVSYGYDANGNMNTRAGASISWYSYNLPNVINGTAGNSSQFFYGPDRSRWKQVAGYSGTSEQTVYIGGLVEKVTLGATTSWKHYIAGSTGTVAVYTRKSTGTNEIHYLTVDHLGSIDSITDGAGAVEVRLSFGSFGQRRKEAGWAGNPTSGDWSQITNTTRHGFTSHETLDNLNLTHMNGRVYDQVLGRFLSADPIGIVAQLTQTWNRYSYVRNGPRSALDPTGFMETVTVTASRSGSDAGNGGQPSAALAPTSGDVNGRLPGIDTGTLEEVIAYGKRVVAARERVPDSRPGAGSQQESTSRERNNFWCEAGNLLETGAEVGGQASMAVEAMGAVVAVGGLVPGATPLAVAGGAAMAAGGLGNFSASGLQTLGGLMQVAGGDSTIGWSNVQAGSLNIIGSVTPIGLTRYLGTAGRTVSQRIFNSQLQASFAGAGLVSDGITFLAPETAPKQATCSSEGAH
jgi:RHS repeat-associated protein